MVPADARINPGGAPWLAISLYLASAQPLAPAEFLQVQMWPVVKKLTGTAPVTLTATRFVQKKKKKQHPAAL